VLNASGLVLSIFVLLVFGSITGCSRKARQTAPPPEVLVTMVTERDVPVVQEGVATLEGFITANIHAQDSERGVDFGR
jgi:hypothetical protein